MVETLGYNHPEYKNSFKVKISGTRPLPWAWGATNVPCPLGSMLGLGSCKRFEKNQLIPSKPHFLSFPHKSYGLGPCLKYNIIHELSPQGSRAWLNWACRKYVSKIGINNHLLIEIFFFFFVWCLVVRIIEYAILRTLYIQTLLLSVINLFLII